VLSLVVVLGAALLVLGLTGRLSSAEDPADRALQARLPAAVFGSCSPVEQAAGETAALRCAGTDPRVERLEVRQVPDAAALGTRFAALSADRGLVTRRCQDEAGNSGGFWTRGGTRQGAFACFTDAAGARRVLWQYDADGVEVQAVGGQSGADGAAALYTWWSDEARDRPLAG
jgi:hypothetical protein